MDRYFLKSGFFRQLTAESPDNELRAIARHSLQQAGGGCHGWFKGSTKSDPWALRKKKYHHPEVGRSAKEPGMLDSRIGRNFHRFEKIKAEHLARVNVFESNLFDCGLGFIGCPSSRGKCNFRIPTVTPLRSSRHTN